MILVFGKSGQVARELAGQAGPGGVCLGRDACDLTTPGAARRAIRDHAPRVVINAAAYTAVDQAEQDYAAAMQINGHAVADMARTCTDLGIPLVHLSTDYVFSGRGSTPQCPDDPTGPLGVYGYSKLTGERAIRASGGVHVILRTSWVFSARGQNFLTTVQRLAATRTTLPMVADQIGGPTPAADVAAACLTIADQLCNAPDKSGTYHFSGYPDVSWAEFARTILTHTGQGCRVTDIPSASYPTPAQRPLNSRLDCSRTRSTFGLRRPDWQRGISALVKGIAHAA